MSKIKLDAWEQALADTMIDRAEPVPAGWITKADFARGMDLSHAQGGKQIQRLVEAGKVDAKKFRIVTGNRLLQVLHYRLKK